MRRVADGLRLAGSVVISNIWLMEDPSGRRFVVDTGHPLERMTLRASLWRAGVRGRGDLTAVLLTHRHSDHAGNAAWLRRTYGCPVICHERDADILTGNKPAPPLARGVAALYEEVLCHIEDRFPARTPVDELYDEGAWKWGFRVVPVPGHTEGSVMLYHEPTRTLFSGDAILTGPPPLRAIEYLRLAVPGFSLHVDGCRDAVRGFLRELPPVSAVAAGHGPLLRKDAENRLRRLLHR
ncbi:MAG: MBL fold metallo-hydrolase [Myxococcota bacterium]